MPIENTNPLTNDRIGSGLRTLTRVMDVSSAAAPTVGQVLTATSGDAASWQSPIMFSIIPAGGFALTDGTTAQAAFPTTGDVWSLDANTTYQMQGLYLVEKSTTSTTISLIFDPGASGLTFTSVLYASQFMEAAAANTLSTSQQTSWVNQATVTAVTPGSTTYVLLTFSGLLRIAVGGTMTPQIKFSAAPGTPVMAANSYISFTRLGTNVENIRGSVG